MYADMAPAYTAPLLTHALRIQHSSTTLALGHEWLLWAAPLANSSTDNATGRAHVVRLAAAAAQPLPPWRRELSIDLSTYLSVYVCICLSVCPSVCLCLYLSVYCLSLCLCSRGAAVASLLAFRLSGLGAQGQVSAAHEM